MKQIDIGSGSEIKYFSAYAKYLLDCLFEDLIEEQVAFAGKIEIRHSRLLYIPTNRESTLRIIRADTLAFLTSLIEKQTKECIRKYIYNSAKEISLSEVRKEDHPDQIEYLILLNYIRKQSLLKFLPQFTANALEIIDVAREIDYYISEVEKALAEVFINNKNVNSAIQYEAETSRKWLDIIVVEGQEEMYSEAEELALMGSFTYDFSISKARITPQVLKILEVQENGAIIETLSKIHPSDRERVKVAIHKAIAEKETFDCEFRYITDQGEKIIWARGFMAKERDKSLMKGIFMDISRHHYAIKKLQRSEELYKEAQALSHIGNYTYEVKNNSIIWTDEIYRIFGLEIQSEEINFQRFLAFIHPDDRNYVIDQINNSILYNQSHSFYYRIVLDNGCEKILHAIGKSLCDESGVVYKLIGTAQDVTEKQLLISRLQNSEELYKQAQALSHIGNYTWDINTNLIYWSEELFKIYELEPTIDPINYNLVAAFNHPDDTERVFKIMQQSIKNKEPFDFLYKIVLPSKQLKILHARGEVLDNDIDKGCKIIGTVEDVTERQTLIERLQHSEQLYKQAEILAKIGNWKWDIINNTLEWTDELYRIYGLLPQSEIITIERFKNFIHPVDKERIINSIEKAFEDINQDYTFKIITDKGEVKTIHSIAQVQLNEKGKPVCIIGIEQDVTEKEKLIQQLQHSEQLYREAQAIAHVGNFEWNFKTDEITWTDEIYKIYGLEPQSEKITFEKIKSFIHPEDKERVINSIFQSIQTTQTHDIIWRIVLYDGTVKSIHRIGKVELDNEGRPYKMVGTVQDVTERENLITVLLENQNFIQKIADATPSIIASYNVNTGNYRFISAGLEKLLGYHPAEVMEENISFFLNIIHPNDLLPIMEKNAKALELANQSEEQSSTIVEFQYRLRHKNGQYRWFHTYGTVFDRNIEGKVEHVLNISIDITDKVEAEQKLKEQELFIQHIADASPTILYLYDTKGEKIIYINKEVSNVLGYSSQEIIDMGSSFARMLYHSEDLIKISDNKNNYNNIDSNESLIQYECRMKNKNGKWRWLLVREIVFKRNQHKEATQVLAAALDITERRDIEFSLFQKTIQLQQSNASLEEFAYIASHDLKEPLRKISVFGDRLLSTQYNKLSSDGIFYLNKIIDSSNRMQTMINDLLSVSMVSGDKSLQFYSLQEVLDDVLRTLEYKIEEKNATIQYENLPDAYINPLQFRQLLQNLISNSLKFSRNNVQPKIEITCTWLTLWDVKKFDLQKAKRYLQISISDNGIGFNNQFAEKIFFIFQRLHQKSEYEGTGIGLAICKRIIENHNGIIFASGIENQGATVTLIIPQ